MCEWDHKEGWALKNWCFLIVVLEKTLETPLDSKIKQVSYKGNQSWIFTGRTDAEAEIPILWPPDVKNWLIGKDPDAGKDRRQEEKEQQRMRWLDGITDSMHGFGWTLGVGDGQGGLLCCGSWSHKESDMTERLNWRHMIQRIYKLLTKPNLDIGAFPMAQQVKNPPAMQEAQEIQVRSLDQEDPLEKEMATHSSILAWEIPWTEKRGRLWFMGSQRVGYDWASEHTHTQSRYSTWIAYWQNHHLN